jgi:hypothetical protein
MDRMLAFHLQADDLRIHVYQREEGKWVYELVLMSPLSDPVPVDGYWPDEKTCKAEAIIRAQTVANERNLKLPEGWEEREWRKV